ncbi:MAG: His/Gly/Thr/Pro-type tRNA ligase C-terminal domain-containing protein [bacterium]|nr:His/Gly/Thr/Pro-type tRNA ligase C-terminal domain-containing protein [bacterium]
MFRLKDTRHQNTAEFLSSAIRIAEYYGFSSLEEAAKLPRPKEIVVANQNQPEKRKIPSAAECESEMIFAHRDERALVSAAKRCLSSLRDTGSRLLWRRSSGASRERSNVPSVVLELHVVGSSGAVAEALLIVVADAIAAEAGIKQRVLSINSIGSTDSSNRYVRDIGIYLRKHIESISPTLRPRVGDDPLGVLIQLIERGHPAAPRAPQSMEYLTEDERRKFWNLLEYLEVFGLPYELNPQVLGSRDCWVHSIFEIAAVDEETGARILLAYGGRYDPLAARFSAPPVGAGHVDGVPAAVISIACEIHGKMTIKHAERVAPALYFAHLGPEARRRSLGVMETLRKAEIPVYQSLLYERIGEQMEEAKRYAVPYILLMGHKEAMENTILVREVSTNSQNAIPLPELTNYLKRHRVVATA